MSTWSVLTASESWAQFLDKLWLRRVSVVCSQLRFIATMGNGFQGDIAIDNILIIPGSCPGKYRLSEMSRGHFAL